MPDSSNPKPSLATPSPEPRGPLFQTSVLVGARSDLSSAANFHAYCEAINRAPLLPDVRFIVDETASGPAKRRKFDFTIRTTNTTVGTLQHVRATAHAIGGSGSRTPSGKFVQILLLMRGELFLTVRNRTSAMHRHALFIKDPAEPFLAVARQEVEWFSLILPADYFHAHTSAAAHTYFGEVIELEAPDERLLRNVLVLVSQFLDDLDPRDAGDACDGILCFLRPALKRHYRAGREDEGLSAHEKVRRDAVNVMQKRLSRPNLSMAEVAKACGISPRLLSIVFREAGTTPAAHLLELRLSHAKVYLTEEHAKPLPIAIIGANCGFASAAHFSRAFKARYGMTPSEMKRKGVLET